MLSSLQHGVVGIKTDLDDNKLTHKNSSKKVQAYRLWDFYKADHMETQYGNKWFNLFISPMKCSLNSFV